MWITFAGKLINAEKIQRRRPNMKKNLLAFLLGLLLGLRFDWIILLTAVLLAFYLGHALHF